VDSLSGGSHLLDGGKVRCSMQQLESMSLWRDGGHAIHSPVPKLLTTILLCCLGLSGRWCTHERKA
jgi:hypothetical protein